jgi:hypothetical protein
MDQKLRLRRINHLYADLDLPAFNPVAPAPQLDPGSESLPSPVEAQSPDVIPPPERDQIESQDVNETIQASDVSTLPLVADPELDVIVLPEMDQLESQDVNETAQALDVSTLPLVADPGLDVITPPQTDQIESIDPDETTQLLDVSALPMIADPIPAPLTAAPRVETQIQAAGSPDRPSKADEPRQADWKALGIGALTGSLVSAIILLITLQMNIFNNPGRFALWGGEMFLGIVGALIANAWRSTARDLWRGAIQWTLIPVWFALLIGFILFLLTFTSLTG